MYSLVLLQALLHEDVAPHGLVHGRRRKDEPGCATSGAEMRCQRLFQAGSSVTRGLRLSPLVSIGSGLQLGREVIHGLASGRVPVA